MVIPLFPLPTTVFYPNTFLPLHIFEPRYRCMVADALEGGGKIGMILLKAGWEKDYHGTPEIMNIGCMGKIERHSQLPEGKYNILLSGIHRFRILQEIGGKLYRQAKIEILEEINNQNLTVDSLPIKKQVIEMCDKYEKPVFGFSASMATNVMIDELYPIVGDKCWMIDFGSIWYPFVGNITRSYHHRYESKEIK